MEHLLSLQAPNGPRVVHAKYDWTQAFQLDDFTQAQEDTAGDCFDSGTGVVAATAGPVVKLLSTNANDDCAVCQKVKPFYMGDRGSVLMFQTRIYLSDSDGSAWAIGVYNANDISSASPLDGTAYVEDGIFFVSEQGDDNVDFATEKNGADATYTNRVNAIGTTADATWMTLAFEVQHSPFTSGTFFVKCYVNGTLVNIGPLRTLTSGVPNDVNLAMSIAHRGGAGDYMLVGAFEGLYQFPGEYIG